MKQTFSIKESIKTGWEIFKERSWFIIGLFLIVMAASAATSIIIEQTSGMVYFVLNVVDFGLQTIIGMGLLFILLAVYDKKQIGYKDWLTPAASFWSYLAVIVLSAIAIIGGLILFIIPGIIASMGLMFAPYLVVEKGMGPIMAIKKSWEMSKGYRWQLFLFTLVLILLNIVGAMALVIGLIVTIPVSSFAAIHVYRQILQAQPQEQSDDK